jgi:uncharacterized protein (TIGR03086 family)
MLTADSLQLVSDEFRGLVRSVGDDQWSLPTPCDGWTVRHLVGHVASGSEMVAALAAGASRNDAITVLGVDHLGDDPVAAVDRALERQLSVFGRAGVDVQVFRHPAGDMPGSMILMFRVSDLLVHHWDLARAIGADESIDESIVRDVWDGVAPMLPMMASSGVFGEGPSGTLDDDAPLQSRLLDAMGRRP